MTLSSSKHDAKSKSHPGMKLAPVRNGFDITKLLNHKMSGTMVQWSLSCLFVQMK